MFAPKHHLRGGFFFFFFLQATLTSKEKGQGAEAP
jgi:hypothetical protein